MRVRFIINPRAGRDGRGSRLRAEIQAFVRSAGLAADVVTTDGPRHATDLARAAVLAGCETVVAVGGDGTMNEVAQGVAGTAAALALVPRGSGNGLALHLGIPRTLRGSLALIRSGGRCVSIDTGAADGRPFFNAMGLGFDADVSRRFNALRRRGLTAYVRAALQALSERRAERFVVTAGARRIELAALLVAVANSDQYGNQARIAPGAQVDDGLLDLVAVKTVGLRPLALLLPRLFLGQLHRSRHVVRLRAPAFEIERVAAGVMHTDGEVHDAAARVRVEVRPCHLRVLVPAASRLAGAAPGRPAAGRPVPLP